MVGLIVVAAPMALVGMAAMSCVGVVWTSSRGRVFADSNAVPYVDCVVVLGCAPTLRDGRANLYFEARLDAAARLYFEGRTSRLLVSGGPARDSERWRSECDAMREGLMVRGVPSACISADEQGTRTRKSVERAKHVFGLAETVFVSQAFHGPRAVFLARDVGLSAFAFAAASPPLTSRKHLAVLGREILSCTRAVLEGMVTKKNVPEG